MEGGNNNGKNLEEGKLLWKKAMQHYASTMKVLLSEVNVTEQDIVKMQHDFDIFGDIFFSLRVSEERNDKLFAHGSDRTYHIFYD